MGVGVWACGRVCVCGCVRVRVCGCVGVGVCAFSFQRKCSQVRMRMPITSVGGVIATEKHELMRARLEAATAAKVNVAVPYVQPALMPRPRPKLCGIKALEM